MSDRMATTMVYEQARARALGSRDPSPLDKIRVRPATRAERDESLAQFPDRTVFCRLAWLESICETQNFKVVLHKATFRGRDCALWLLLKLRKGPFRVFDERPELVVNKHSRHGTLLDVTCRILGLG